MSSTPPNPFGPADPVNPDSGEVTPPAVEEPHNMPEPADAADSAVPDDEGDGSVQDAGLPEG